MDLDLIAALLRPFLYPPAHNIATMSCAGPHATGPRGKDDSRGSPRPGNAGPSDTDRQGQVPLSRAQLGDISTYIDILIRWNSRINLTAIRGPEEIVTRHFGESLFAARHLLPKDLASTKPASTATTRVAPGRSLGDPDDATETSAPHLLDIGSGAGFPALPIKIWAPQVHLTMVESNQKKTTFLREISRALTFTHVNVVNSRAEDLPASTADIVSFRAVEHFHSILPIAIRLARLGGSLALLIGESQVKDAQIAGGVEWHKPIPIPQSSSRVLLIGNRRD